MKPGYRLVFTPTANNLRMLAAAHAPAGGITLGGKKFKGGQFIEAKYLTKATTAQRQQLDIRRELFDTDDDIAVMRGEPIKADATAPKAEEVLFEAVSAKKTGKAEKDIGGGVKGSEFNVAFSDGTTATTIAVNETDARQQAVKERLGVPKPHDEAMKAIPIGQSGRVAGFMVSRQGEDAFRIEKQTGRGYVAGDAKKIAEYIDSETASQKLYGKQVDQAMARAESFTEPDWTDAKWHHESSEAFKALPNGTPVVSLDDHAGTKGRVGKVVRDPVTGANKVQLDGEAGFASNDVEPLDAKLSWRVPKAAEPKKKAPTSLFDAVDPEEVLHDSDSLFGGADDSHEIESGAHEIETPANDGKSGLHEIEADTHEIDGDQPNDSVSPAHEEAIASARETDKKFKGDGRYEAELWMRLKAKNPDAKLPALSKAGAEYARDEYESDGKAVPAEVLAGYSDLAPKGASPAKAKEPWEMTADEFTASQGGSPSRYVEQQRAAIVKQAIKAGKAVPAEVLADYPDLAPKPATFDAIDPEEVLKDDETDAPTFQPANFLKIAADDIGSLRKMDVDRLISSAKPENRVAMADYITANRPEFAQAVKKSMDDAEAEAGAVAKPDYSHLNSLEERLDRERDRLASAKTEKEKKFRQQQVDSAIKEIAGERKFLGLEDDSQISDDELVASLMDGNDKAAPITPSADRHDEIHKELQAIYKDPGFAKGERGILDAAQRLADELAIHKPAAIARAQAEIDAEKAKKAEKEAKQASSLPKPAASTDPHISLAESILKRFDSGDGIDAKTLQKLANEAHGGTKAEGKWGPSDAYDSLEYAFNKHLQGKTDPSADLAAAQDQAREIAGEIKKLPTQTNRSGNKDSFQQFSTPPHYSYAAAWLANIKPGEVVLEPSAGTGSLAVQAENAGGKVYSNELDPRRAEFLKDMFGDENVHIENAEQIAGILPKKGVPAPSVVVMNPPFSQTAGRMGDKKELLTGGKHIEEAMRMLAPGGRLVAIVGEGMTPDKPTYREWFEKMAQKYNFRASIGVSGDEYKKYGTGFGTRMLVFDKIAPTGTEPIVGDAKDIPDLMAQLQGVRDDRQYDLGAGERSASEPIGSAGDETARPEGEPKLPIPAAAGDPLDAGESRPGGMGSASESGIDAGGRSGLGDVDVRGQSGGAAGGLAGGAEQESGSSPAAPGSAPTGADGAKSPRGRRKSGGGKPDQQPSANVPRLSVAKPIEYNERSDSATEKVQNSTTPEGSKSDAQEDAQSHLGDSLFEQYKPARVEIPGAHKHPTALVESAAMSAVSPPVATYHPVLAPEIVKDGMLSEAALENVIYAGQAHSSFLPTAEGEPPVRRGYFVGDGTGAGKGRQIAGIITDNFNQDRKRAVWVTEKATLLEDARRDWRDLGHDPKEVFPFAKIQKDNAPDEGVSVVTYDTLKGQPKDPTKPTNLQQLVDWLGKDFDGVIAFDESHNLGNAIASEGGRGKKKPSKKALAGIDLQKMLPNARVVYVSATGATNVSNLAYAERLGLWGRGASFAKKEEFINEMERGGVAAMESVAQNLKAMGAYSARSLSFDDGTPKGRVTYDRLAHEMTANDREEYDALAEAWQSVLQNVDKALETTGGNESAAAKSAAASQFWGAQQRFFNQIMTSTQTPTVIREMEKDIKEGRAPVIQLTNTMEASTKRAISQKDDDQDYEELDISPKQILMQYLEKSFPIHRYQEVMDADGNTRMEIVKDGNGNPVEDPEAVAIRDQLMDRVGSLKIKESPLDMIINHFGTENVSEVTGRTTRLVDKPDENGVVKRTPESRNAANANPAETSAFQNGRKKILVFSQAGGTGRSYHADRNAENNKQRVHYLLQPGWRADAAVQGLGRTHRTNQESAPIYRLVEIDKLKAQKRFISTIARRLDQLGALTRGQRQAGSTGIFKAADNLESTEAKQALEQFFNDVKRGAVEGVEYNDLLKQMGFKKDSDDQRKGPPKKFETPPMTQFLNRLLSLKVDAQSKVFDAFEERLEAKVEQAVREGTLDVGVENFPADRIAKKKETVVHRDPETGAEAKHIVMTATKKAERHPFETTQKGKKPLQYVRNVRSGRVYAVYEGGNRTNSRTGQVVGTMKLMGPTSVSYKAQHEVDTDGHEPKYEKLDESTARKLWDDEHDAAPATSESTEHFIVGAFLPVWNRLPANGTPKIYRMRTDDGQTVVGRHIPNSLVEQTLKNLGVSHEKQAVKPHEAHQRIASGKSEVALANGWKMRPRMVAGERRIELTGPGWPDHEELVKDGVIKERIQYDTRLFVPTGEAGAKVMERITPHRFGDEHGHWQADHDVSDAGHPVIAHRFPQRLPYRIHPKALIFCPSPQRRVAGHGHPTWRSIVLRPGDTSPVV
jgi:hypothetical protein